MADHLNSDLIGIPGGRARLQTPALVIDLDVFERNVARMSEHARKSGVALLSRQRFGNHRKLMSAETIFGRVDDQNDIRVRELRHRLKKY